MSFATSPTTKLAQKSRQRSSRSPLQEGAGNAPGAEPGVLAPRLVTPERIGAPPSQRQKARFPRQHSRHEAPSSSTIVASTGDSALLSPEPVSDRLTGSSQIRFDLSTPSKAAALVKKHFEGSPEEPLQLHICADEVDTFLQIIEGSGTRLNLWEVEEGVVAIELRMASHQHDRAWGALWLLFRLGINMLFPGKFGPDERPAAERYFVTDLTSVTQKERGIWKGGMAPDGNLFPALRMFFLGPSMPWEISRKQSYKSAQAKIKKWLSRPCVKSAVHLDVTGNTAILQFYRNDRDDQGFDEDGGSSSSKEGGEALLAEEVNSNEPDDDDESKEDEGEGEDPYEDYLSFNQGLGSDVDLKPAIRVVFNNPITDTELDAAVDRWCIFLRDCFLEDHEVEWAKFRLPPDQGHLVKKEVPKEVQERIDKHNDLIPVTKAMFKEFSQAVFQDEDWGLEETEGVVNARKKQGKTIVDQLHKAKKRAAQDMKLQMRMRKRQKV
ncbi:hypothetical protein PM082_016376 [Marasmius tenuissimus]|nr:hypothetical protein PM082_016376 [Marasmius tenuissimus]